MCSLTGLALLTAALAGGPALAADSPRQALVWIRAGALSPAELDPDPAVTPRLRQLLLEGVTAAELDLGKTAPAAAADPRAAAAALFDAPARAAIADRRGEVVEIEAGAAEPIAAAGSSGAAPRWRHPVALLLARRFGPVPPPTDEEEAAVGRVRAAIGEQPSVGGPKLLDLAESKSSAQAPAPPGKKVSAVAATADPEDLEVLKRALFHFERGVPLVIVCERVGDPGAAGKRDAALGQAAAWTREQGAVLLVLSLSAGKPPRATLFIAGPGVREGRIVGKPLPIAAVAATAFEVLGVPPPAGFSGEAIHALER